jgi:hypothetical protein
VSKGVERQESEVRGVSAFGRTKGSQDLHVYIVCVCVKVASYLTFVCIGCGVNDGAGSPAGSDADVSDMGIVQGHAYGILKVCAF